jgi:hypothetical protein
MTRHRKGLRPLSQTGFHHIPHNPRQRVPGEGGIKSAGKVLDAFNERQDDRQLHPTKGWRGLSVKRSRAQALMAEIRHGRGRPLHLQARFLSEGY